MNDDPIKRTFIVDGKQLTANAAISRDSGDARHTQKEHDEPLVMIHGKLSFRVGEEVNEVKLER